jgi:hypothetical protein
MSPEWLVYINDCDITLGYQCACIALFDHIMLCAPDKGLTLNLDNDASIMIFT